MQNAGIECQEYGRELSEEQRPCPSCGSNKRIYYEEAEETMRMSVSVTDLVGHALHLTMYRSALKFSKEAQKSKGQPNEELELSLIAILLAFTTLESYINEYAQAKGLWEKFKEASIEGKWRGVPQRATGRSLTKKAIDRFLELKDLRNYIVHYESKFTEGVEIKPGTRVPEARAKVTCENAIKACDTIKLMITELSKLEGSPIPEWLEIDSTG
jgi:hypothetical protein